MEEYRNRVIKLHAINPRILANLLANLPRTNPRFRGAMGGPTPYEPLPAVFSPPLSPRTRSSSPTQAQRPCMLVGSPASSWVGSRLSLIAVSMNAQGPMAPCWGGKYTREKARIWGVVYPPYLFPTYVPPRWPPHIRGSM